MLAGCGLLPSTPDGVPESWSAEQIYKEAKSKVDDENYVEATTLLEKLESRFPYGRYAQQAQLELIYVYYKNKDEASAIAAADRFIKFHPNSPYVDYAYYMKGLANFIGETGVISSIVPKDMSKRDPKSEIESFEAFKSLVTRFPNSQYAPDSRMRMQYLANMIAMHEIHVADYYNRRGDYVAAINRAQKVLKEFPDTPATENALVDLLVAYHKLGLYKLRDDTYRILEASYPQWRKKFIKTKSQSEWWELWKK